MKNNYIILKIAGATRLCGVLGPCTGSSNIQRSTYSTNVGTSTSTTRTLFFNHIKLADSTFETFSVEWCKEKKLEILKLGSPAVFDDMSKINKKDCLPKPTNIFRELSEKKDKGGNTHVYSNFLKDKAGIYMIYNKVTKKRYIGMSTNLKSRFYNYLNLKRLDERNHSRIHKALLKYGFNNFSVSILELAERRSELRQREDFFIKIFNPQYNIAKSYFTAQGTRYARDSTTTLIMPHKIKEIMKKCINPEMLDWHILIWNFMKNTGVYSFLVVTPTHYIHANSSGWFEGKITKQLGYIETKKVDGGSLGYKTMADVYKLIDKKRLADFVNKGGEKFIKDSLKEKLKAYKRLKLKEGK